MWKDRITNLFFPGPQAEPPGRPTFGEPPPTPTVATGIERSRAEWIQEGCLACDHHDPTHCCCGGNHGCHWKPVKEESR
jgi:hypothetical protein